MRVAHIAFLYGLNDTGGAAIAATRLHNTLIESGVESHYICLAAKETGKNVHVLPSGLIQRFTHWFLGKVTRYVWRFTSYGHSLETNILPLLGLAALLNKIKPDIVHVHWLNRGVMSFEQLANLKFPCVINLHDMFMINVLLPHAGDDNRYITGLSKNNSAWWERWLFKRKRVAVSKVRPCFLAPSNWMCSCAKKSIIARDFNVVMVPNIIDKAFYKYERQVNREGKFVVLFGANGGRRNQYKGYDDLARAISIMPDEMKHQSELWVFGEGGCDDDEHGLKVHLLGVVKDVQRLKEIYSQAALFVLPSRLDNAPSTKFEALLSGVPVVAFNRTGCAEFIEHGVNGWVAEDGNVEAFEKGIEYFYHQHCEGGYVEKQDAIARDARSRFATETVVSQLMGIYKRVMDDALKSKATRIS